MYGVGEVLRRPELKDKPVGVSQKVCACTTLHPAVSIVCFNEVAIGVTDR